MTEAVTTHPVAPDDLATINDLHARVFGPGRFTRTAYRIREGTAPISRFCRKAVSDGRLIAAIRFTDITIGGRPGAILLGPLAVEPALAGLGHGRRLIAEGIEAARTAGVELVLLVGDEPYYGRFGFRRLPPGQVRLPGPVDPARLLAAELVEGAAARLTGLVAAAPSAFADRG